MNKTLLTAVAYLIYQGSAFAGMVNMDIIKDIESSAGKDRSCYILSNYDLGLFQITPPVLKEYNQFHGKRVARADLLDDKLNTRIADWYMNVRIPQLLKHFKLADTLDNRLICYNSGIRALTRDAKLSSKQKHYLKKYHARET